MLKISCLTKTETAKIIDPLIDELRIVRSEDAEIAVVEEGLPLPDTALTIVFNPDRLDLLSEALKKLSREDHPETLIIGSRNNTFKPLDTDSILFFEADGNYVYAETESQRYEVKHRLYELEERFSDGPFIRIGKSLIVNIMQVDEIIPWFGSRLLLRINGTDRRVEVSRNYVKSFKRYLEL